MKATVKRVTFTVMGGIAIMLVTGLIDHTPEMLVGAAYYGYPFAWLERLVIAPQYFPWVVRPMRLILDVVVWTFVVWVILYAVSKVRKK